METWDFDFNEADIFANRQGILSARQQTFVDLFYHMRRRGANQTLLAFVILLPLLVVIGIAIEFNKWEGTFTAFIEETWMIWAMLVGVFSLILLVSTLVTNLTSRSARNHRISIAEGTASVFIGEGRYKSRTYPRYELTLKRGRSKSAFFRFTTENAVRRFEEGKSYRVYYIKYYPLPVILSAEEI